MWYITPSQYRVPVVSDDLLTAYNLAPWSGLPQPFSKSAASLLTHGVWYTMNTAGLVFRLWTCNRSRGGKEET
jgi:hypothetical protein